MKTVVFTKNADFTIISEVKIIGEPINEKKWNDKEAIFNKKNKVGEIFFYVPIDANEYGHTNTHLKVWLSADSILSVAAMINKIIQISIEPGVRDDIEDDLPF